MDSTTLPNTHISQWIRMSSDDESGTTTPAATLAVDTKPTGNWIVDLTAQRVRNSLVVLPLTTNATYEGAMGVQLFNFQQEDSTWLPTMFSLIGLAGAVLDHTVIASGVSIAVDCTFTSGDNAIHMAGDAAGAGGNAIVIPTYGAELAEFKFGRSGGAGNINAWYRPL